MAAPSRYLFDVDFSPGPKPTTTIALSEHKAKLAEAEAQGYRNGFQAAEAEMRADTTRRLTAVLEQMSGMLENVAQGLSGIESRLEAEAVDVAAAVARKLAPALIAREPLAEIDALVSENFRHLVASPHIAVRISESLYEPARERLDAIAAQCGFAGRLLILADPDVTEGDCRVEWADGGVTRDRAAVEAVISETVERFVAARRSPADGLLKGAEQ